VVTAVLNFAPVSLQSRRGVKVKTVDLSTSLESLSYFLASPSVGNTTRARREARNEDISQREQRI